MHVRTTRRWPLLAVTLVSLAAAAPTASADEAPSAWLMRLTEAARSLNYDGTFVYRNGEWMESVRIIHRAGPGGSKARMVALTGEAREVIRDDNRVTCYLPDAQAVLVSKKRPGVLSSSVFNPRRDFGAHYRLDLEPGQRVAGRATRLLTVTPNDAYRYGYRLFVDETSSLVLRSELVAASGQAIEQIEFTTISMPEHIPDALLEPSLESAGFTWYTADAPQRPPERSEFTVTWLPPGFEMADRQTDPAAAGRMPVEHLVYTDGLATVSVFIEHLKSPGEALKGPSAMGAVSAFGLMIDTFQVTAVGEVPPLTVQRVAESVARR